MLHFSLKALQISIYNTHFQIITSQAQSYKPRRYFPKNSVFQSILKLIKKELKKRKKKTICNAPQKICNPSVRSVKLSWPIHLAKEQLTHLKKWTKKTRLSILDNRAPLLQITD